MSLKIYNTLTRKEEAFVPLTPKKVKMYVCGPTVYDVLHVGNFRGVIFFNAVRRWLEHSGYHVQFVYNYTDIDDKIINKAKEEKTGSDVIAARFISEYERDFRALKLTAHDANPRATQYIGQMVETIAALIEKKKAYVIEGQVFYAVDSFKNYGKLSNKNLEELEVGYRVDVDPRKKNPLDFVLWKPSKEGEPSWESPWGPGRPGWHIECSVMIKTLLGESIDIHGGGIDLIFPHHENEIAQSEGLTGKPFVKYWMHNNFINFGETKMSKSLGNVVSARSFIEQYNPELFKYLILSVHYRSPLSLADTQIHQAMASLARIYAALSAAEDILAFDVKPAAGDRAFQKILEEADGAFAGSMNDDFNTPAAFARIFEVVRAFNALLPKKLKPDAVLKVQAGMFKEWLLKWGRLFSLFGEPPGAFLRQLDTILLREKGLQPEAIDAKVLLRNKARADRDFKTADAIRDELAQLGIEIHDTANGSSWQVRKGDAAPKDS